MRRFVGLLPLAIAIGFALSLAAVSFGYSDEDNFPSGYVSPSSGSPLTGPQLSTLMPGDAFQKGVDCLLSQKYDEAERVFRYCLQQEPTNAEYICWLGQVIALDLGEKSMKGASRLSLLPDGRTLCDLFDKALALDPQNDRAKIGRALIFRETPGWLGGSVKKCEEMLRDVLQKNPNNLSAKHYLGTVHIKNHKKYEEGIAYLQEVLKTAKELAQKTELTPEDQFNLFRTHHALGKTYLENLKQPELAIPYLEKSLEINPEFPDSLLDMADAYQAVGRNEEAKKILRTVAGIIQKNEYIRFKKELTQIARALDMKKELDL